MAGMLFSLNGQCGTV